MKVRILDSLGGSDEEGQFAYQKGEVLTLSATRYNSVKGSNVEVLTDTKTKTEKRPSNTKTEKR